MPDFNVRIWNEERIYMVDFGRARSASHPRRHCPDVDRTGFHDDAHANEHGPIISARVGQPRVDVRFYRAEISTGARLYAVAADRNQTIRITRPNNGVLASRVASTISFRPVRAGRTCIEIRYHWPDGPVIGRLYVVVRATRNVNVRAHIVTVGGVAAGANYLGEARPAGTGAGAHRQQRIRDLITDVNHVMEPHGIRVRLRESVLTPWTNALFGASPSTTTRVMRAMANSPNRSANRVNLYLVDGGTLPFAINFVALGPPIAWAVQTGRRWPNTPAGKVGSGIIVDTTASPLTGTILAHEFGHVFSLCSILTAGANAGRALQWHAIGDTAGAGNTHGHASRDDKNTRRRLMYPFTTLANSNNNWRNNVGYGNNMGAMLTHRRLQPDITFDESDRMYRYVGTAANIYAN